MHLAKEILEQVNDEHAKLVQIKVYKRNTYAGRSDSISLSSIFHGLNSSLCCERVT